MRSVITIPMRVYAYFLVCVWFLEPFSITQTTTFRVPATHQATFISDSSLRSYPNSIADSQAFILRDGAGNETSLWRCSKIVYRGSQLFLRNEQSMTQTGIDGYEQPYSSHRIESSLWRCSNMLSGFDD